MRFLSTRNTAVSLSLEEALFSAMAEDGGLYFPQCLRSLEEQVLGFRELGQNEIALRIAEHLLGEDLSERELADLIERSLDFPLPLAEVRERMAILELFHGPTLAFKDVGARFMAALMGHYRRGEDRDLTILVATSGDTGSAVAHAFLEQPGFRVVVLFPEGKISEPQRKLFTTLRGNVEAIAIRGTFDDCQRLVKRALSDKELRQSGALASANSINVGRLLPQIFYYFIAYAQLPAGARRVVVATPSGNFGNLTAGLMAKRLGLPIDLFVAATNINDVVPEYLETGVFSPRSSRATLTNAMDVGNPSNFERILYLYDSDIDRLRRDLAGSSHTDAEVRATIGRVYRENGYLLDPHSAIGFLALEAQLERDPDAQGVFLGTAHPAKFPETVEDVLETKIEMPNALLERLDLQEQIVTLEPHYSELFDVLTA